MAQRIRERTIEEIQKKLETMHTALNKLAYIEIALKEVNVTMDTKRFLLKEAEVLYESRKMYDKAAKAMENKAAIEVLARERIESFLRAAELYARSGKAEHADDMFLRAGREATIEQKQKIELAKKNIYTRFAQELEKQGKKASAVKFYERLMKMNIDTTEKQNIKRRLQEIYKSLGMFREARFIEGL